MAQRDRYKDIDRQNPDIKQNIFPSKLSVIERWSKDAGGQRDRD